ncbi:sensor histidine kinase [Spirillospora sp. NBC_01491]|uniref:sensor histidine kinase n=1 Tax=Spirillospora sp. NBC_01491 TaxID=2976007 RepID=UPI002E2F95CF|nr:histidine kinase [Spirillospora sp. NBC_01491]
MTRTARLTVVTVLASCAAVYLLAAPSRTEGGIRLGAAVVVIVAACAVQLVWIVPGLARFRGPWAVALQGGLAYASVLASGTSVGLLGFVAGSLLLVSAWPAAIAVAGTAAVIEAGRSAGAAGTVDATITMVLTGLLVYGLVRLADRAADTAAARLPLTVAAVERERLRIAAELNEGLGRGLETIIEGSRRALDRPAEIGAVLEVARRSLADARTAAAAFRGLSLAPEAAAARALLAAAGIEAEIRTGHAEPLGPGGALLATVLREAVTDVVRQGTAARCVIETAEADGTVRLRVANDGEPTAARGADGLAEAAARVEAAGGAFATGLGPDGWFAVEAAAAAGDRPVNVPDRAAYWLSVTVLAAVLAGFCAKGLLQLEPGPGALAAATAVLPLVAALRLHRTGGAFRPRVWTLILTVQALLTFVPLLWFGAGWLGVPGFFAGTLLVVLPGRAGTPLVAAVLAGVAVAGGALSPDPARLVNYVISTLVTALVVYGLVRLARLVSDLQDAGAGLARAATVEERLRAARDLHDLLGHSLAAILLKCELARRLAVPDPDRARAELAEVVEMAGRARADLRTATGGDDPETSLDEEARSARSVLAAAGAEVVLDLGHGDLPAPASAVLGTVLREAVTNILRHSAARHCAIATVRREDGTVLLTVENDGLDPRAPRTPPGAGIGNLTTRLASFGGTLTARADGHGRFRLEATVTLDAGASPEAPAARISVSA